ncbi:MAG: prenyltransferase/squalene oxidase repeat-containing protein, partial [Planctomycetia bacterium]
MASQNTPNQGGQTPASAPTGSAQPAAAKPGPVIPKPAAAAPQPAAQAAGGAADAAPPAGRTLTSGLLKQTPAWAVSMLVHIVVLLSMALVVNEAPKQEAPREITASAPEVEESFDDLAEEEMPQEINAPQEQVTDAVTVPDSTTVEQVSVVSAADDLDAAPVAVELSDFGTESVAASELLETVGAVGGKTPGGLGGRMNSQMRAQLVQSGGGNKDTEAAVESGIKWIVSHQLPDGGWSFDLTKCPSCQGQCTHGVDKGGFALDRCGATSMALLPFLGRGYTHKDGPYKKQVEAGLYFLASMTVQGQGKAYAQGGNMYSQGLAGIVLSESYAMTQDKRLAVPAQAALNYIMAAQDPAGGGWRYAPKQPGDTSAVGWQLMALKSGHMAFLQVSPLTIKKAVSFLDHVQGADGATYGDTDPGNGAGTTAVGLLCRMYLGWKKDNPALQRGVDRLAK